MLQWMVTTAIYTFRLAHDFTVWDCHMIVLFRRLKYGNKQVPAPISFSLPLAGHVDCYTSLGSSSCDFDSIHDC
jgi:hypothetical protein